MSPSMKLAISLLLVCTLVITCATEDSPLYLKAFAKQRKTYTYRHLTRQEIKEAVARSVLRKKLFIRVIIVLIKAAVFFYLTSRLLSPGEAVLFTGWNELALGFVLSGIREKEVDPRLEVIEEDNMLRVRITKPMTIEFEKKSGDAKLLAIMLDKANLLPARNGRTT